MIETSKRFLNALKFLVVLENRKMLKSLSNFAKQKYSRTIILPHVLFSQLMEAFFNLFLAVLLYIAIQNGVVLDEKMSGVVKTTIKLNTTITRTC